MKLKSLLTTLAAAVGLTTAATAATPVAVWDGFTSLTSGDYTWTADSTCTISNGVVTIGSAGGLTIANPTGLGDKAVTFIADIEGFNPSGTQMTIFDIGVGANRVNISSRPSDNNVYQLWNGNNGYGNVGTISTGKVRIITTYKGGTGTTTYIIGGNTADSTKLHSSTDSITSIGIGCYSTSQRVANGMKVYRLAMFNSKLSETDAKAYKFPSEEETFDCNATIEANADINWSDIDWDNEPTETSTVALTLEGDATITVAEAAACGAITVKGTGTLTLDAGDNLTSEKITSKIPLVITTAKNQTVDAGSNDLTYNYTGEEPITPTISTSGTFTKEGDGTIVINLGSSRTAETIINAGTLAFAAQMALGNGAPITVNDDGTLDFNGHPNGGNATTVTLNGGTMKNGTNGGGGTGQMQIKSLTLTADSVIDTPYEFGMVGSQYGATTIALGEYTLTKRGEGTFHIANATISGTGEIIVEEGTLDFFNKGSVFSNGTLELAGGTLNRNAAFTASNVTVTADSAITGSGNLIAPIAISDGATLDCTAISLPIAGASLAATQAGTLKVTTPSGAAKIATATETVTGLTLVDENGKELMSCTYDGYFWYGEEVNTYELTEEDKADIGALTQGGVFTKTTTYVGLTTVTGTPEGSYAWVDGATVCAAKKSNSISIKFTPASANEGTIATPDANVGGYPVAGKFWNHSKVSTKTSPTGDGVTEIFALKDGNGETLDGVLCYYYMQNMYDVNKRSVGGRNKQTTGNGKLTYSYFDDTVGLTPAAWPYSVGTYEDREYVLPATPVKEGVTANLRWEVAITNIPYQVFDLYLYQASDQTSETIKLMSLAVKANDGDWHYFAGDGNGSTVVATYDTTWNGAAYCDSETMTEGTHYIRYRMSKAALGLGEDESISVVYLSHPQKHDDARLGLAGVQIVEVKNDGYYTRNAACGSTDWLATGGWKNSSGSEITWENPTGTDVAYATIDADAVSAININGKVVANKVTLVNTAPEEGEDAKTFTFTRSNDGTLTSPIDATGFHGKIVLCEGMTSAITLGSDAHIEVTIPEGEGRTLENVLPSGVTIVGGSVTVKGAGTFVCDGAFPTAYETSLQDSANWTGTVWLKNVSTSGSTTPFANYCNSNSIICVTGVSGWLRNDPATQGVATLELVDENDTIALEIKDSSQSRIYTFNKVIGSGTLKFATKAGTGCAMVLNDVSGFTGKLLSTAGEGTTARPIFIGSEGTSSMKSLISVADGMTIKSGCGWEAGEVAFGATLTVKGAVDDVIVSNVTNAVPVLANTKVTLDGEEGVYCLVYDADAKNVKVAKAVAFTVADCENATFTVAGAFKDGESYYAAAGATITVTYTAIDGYTFISTGTGTLVVNGTASAGASFSTDEKPVSLDVPFIFTIAEGEEGVWTLGGTTVTKAIVDANTSRDIWKKGGGSMTNVVLSRTYFVKAGTMVAGKAKNLTGTVTVDAGATFDFNGQKDGHITINLNGGSLVNNGGEMGTGSRQIEGIALTTNSTVGGTGTLGMSSNQHHANTLDLGGATLTKDGANTFFLCNTTVTNGNVIVSNGVLAVSGTAAAAEYATFIDADLRLEEGATLKVDSNKTLTIGAITANGEGVTINNGGTITPFTLTGSATLTGSGSWGTNTLANGASVTVGINHALTFAGKGTVNATLTAAEVNAGQATLFTPAEGASTVLGTIMYGGKDITDKCTISGNQITAIEREAKIGDVYYITLAEALDAAQGKETVTLLKTVTVASLTVPVDVTLDLNNFQVQTTAVVNNGTIVVYDLDTATALKDLDGTLKAGADLDGGEAMFYPQGTEVAHSTEVVESVGHTNIVPTLYVTVPNGTVIWGQGVSPYKKMYVMGDAEFAGDISAGWDTNKLQTVFYAHGALKLNSDVNIGEYALATVISDALDLNGKKFILKDTDAILTTSTNLVAGTDVTTDKEGYEVKMTESGLYYYYTIAEKTPSGPTPAAGSETSVEKNDEGEYVLTPTGTGTTVAVDGVKEGDVLVVGATVTEIGVNGGEATGAIVKVKNSGNTAEVPNTAMVGWIGNKFSTALNKDGYAVVEGENIPVTPAVDATAETPVGVTDTQASVAMRTIPGLTYQLIRGDEPGVIETALTTEGAVQTAIGVATTLVDTAKPEGKAFYKVQVSK